jgi:hypothetical protein
MFIWDTIIAVQVHGTFAEMRDINKMHVQYENRKFLHRSRNLGPSIWPHRKRRLYDHSAHFCGLKIKLVDMHSATNGTSVWKYSWTQAFFSVMRINRKHPGCKFMHMQPLSWMTNPKFQNNRIPRYTDIPINLHQHYHNTQWRTHQRDTSGLRICY